MTEFNRGHILAALRDPNFINFTDPNRPFAFPVSGGNKGGLAAKFGYVAAQSDRKVLLEINAIEVAGEAPDVVPPQYGLLLASSLDTDASITAQSAQTGKFMIRHQDERAIVKAKSAIICGYGDSMANTLLLPGVLIQGSVSTERRMFRDPILLWGDTGPQTQLTVFGLAAGKLLNVTFWGREWPLDPDNY